MIYPFFLVFVLLWIAGEVMRDRAVRLVHLIVIIGLVLTPILDYLLS